MCTSTVTVESGSVVKGESNQVRLVGGQYRQPSAGGVGGEEILARRHCYTTTTQRNIADLGWGEGLLFIGGGCFREIRASLDKAKRGA